MLKLIVKQKGKIIQEVPLHPGAEYSIGRNKDSSIVLPEQPGISRKHLQLSINDNEKGVVKSLSQISTLNVNGEEVDEGVISIGESFQIQDFEFLFQKETMTVSEIKSEETPSEISKAPPVYNKTESQVTESTPPSSEEPANPDEQISQDITASNTPAIQEDGKTKIMDISAHSEQLSSYLKVSYDDNVPRDIFKLEGEESEWAIGRNEEADIVLDNPNISRKHFKIKKEGNQYFIIDLKSANGTILNDKNLTPGKPYPIQSGDAIYILDIEIIFETKNVSLEKELMKLTPPPPSVPTQGGQNLPAHYMPPPLPVNMPSVIVEEEPEEPPSFFQKNKKRIIIYGSVIVVVGFIFFMPSKKKEEPEKLPLQGELAGLTPQQLQIVKDTYQVAQQLYSQGKFEYCKSEIRKIHEYTESYQDSKKLLIACTLAADNQRRQHDLEQKRKKAEETEKFIQDIANKCDEKFESFTFKHDLIDCLNPAIELAPADGRIQGLIERFEAIEIEKEEKQRKIAERKRFINSISSKYNYAKSLYVKGQILKAMKAYQHFISISNHRELKEKRALAQRELASMKKNFNDNNNRLNSQCESFFNASKFQKAYYACETAKEKIPPPHNKKAINLMNKSKSTLEVAMRPLYEEANLNESVGNISIAMEYWKKILAQDVNAGLYYNRAAIKMSKY